MVLKAARLGLPIGEVPVKFYKDREGRMSHHRRMGWLSPWIAGWINLKVMLVYSPDSFLLKPGLVLLVGGLALTLMLVGGPVEIGPVTFNLYWMLLGVTCATLGYSCLQIGVLARIVHRLRSGLARRIQKTLTYDRGMAIAGGITLVGVALGGILLVNYISGGLRLAKISHPAILGLLLIILGFQTFCFTLLIEMTQRIASTRHS
jgi:hypothetical protein